MLVVHFVSSDTELQHGGKQTSVEKTIKRTFSALDRMLMHNEARDKLIPSIANSLCLCVDLFSVETGEKKALLDVSELPSPCPNTNNIAVARSEEAIFPRRRSGRCQQCRSE